MSTLMLSVSGCRGIVGETLTPEVIARFAGCFGGWLIDRAAGRPVTVVLGRDGRKGCEVVHAAATAGLLGAGVHVVDVGVAMTPTVATATDWHAGNTPHGVVAGMVLTASHNPQQWNGLKCLLAEGGIHGSAACAPPAVCANEIIARFKASAPGLQRWDRVGTLTTATESTQEHVDRLLDALEDAGLTADAGTIGEGLTCAIDCVNASGVEGSRLALEGLGVTEFLQLNADDSGLFPHPPEPTLENLSLPGGLCDAVREMGADVGFAQDPDADRLAIIDERGNYIGEEYTLALGALAVLEAEKRGNRLVTSGPSQTTLVTNLSTSRMIDDIAQRYGARVLRTAVGEANVVEIMKKTNSVLGGEGNGGTIWPRVAYVRDSLASMALVLWLLGPNGFGNGSKITLSALLKTFPSYAIVKRKVDLTRKEDAVAATEKVSAGFSLQKQAIDRQDGVWVNFVTGPRAGKAWLHVRASNTEPIMRLIAEAPTPAEANAILDEAAALISA